MLLLLLLLLLMLMLMLPGRQLLIRHVPFVCTKKTSVLSVFHFSYPVAGRELDHLTLLRWD